MRFAETALFTKQVQEIGDDALLAQQKFLSEQPEAGDMIQGTGGLRKVRVKTAGQSNRAVRAIYLLLPPAR